MTQKNATNSTIEKWLDGRRSQLKVAKTSTTPHGHIVNWVPLESQSKDKIATPPGD
jgi:hypothetical protein